MRFRNTILVILLIFVFTFTITACDEDKEFFVVTFDSNGGDQIADISVQEGKTVNLPIPTKEGYTFVGWFTGEGPNDIQFSNFSPILKDVSLIARWNISNFTITFDSNGGTEIDPITKEYNSVIDNVYNVYREHYTFTGWSPELPERMPAQNITLVATWEIKQYTITFNSNGGSEVESIIQDFDSEVVPFENPTRENYTFIGWSPNLPERMPGENLTLIAQWQVMDPFMELFDEKYAYALKDDAFVETTYVKVMYTAYNSDDEIIGYVFKLYGFGVYNDSGSSAAIEMYLVLDSNLNISAYEYINYGHSRGGFQGRIDRYLNQMIGFHISSFSSEADLESGSTYTGDLIDQMLTDLFNVFSG